MRGDYWMYGIPATHSSGRTSSYARRRYAPAGREPVKIVMLVDNGVDGDSRVQKAARSAAEAGWDVTLLGCSPTAGPAVAARRGAGPAAPDGRHRRQRRSPAAVRPGGPRCPAPGGPRPGPVWRPCRRPGLAAARARPVELRTGVRAGDRRAGPGPDPRPRLPDARGRRPGGARARAPAGGAAGLGRARVPARRRARGATTPAGCPPTWRYEREYVPYADAVVTVSDELAGLLQATTAWPNARPWC